jgi:hypothetical protein
MTISVEDTKELFAGNDSATTFEFDFRTNATTDLTVSVIDDAGVETALVLDTDYSVTLNGNQTTSPGGEVEYPLSGDPLPTDHTLVVLRTQSALQPTPFTSGVTAGLFESKFDNVVALVQQLKERVARSVYGSAGDTTSFDMGTALQRADKFLAFDEDGNVELTAVTEGTLTQTGFDAFLATAGNAAKAAFFTAVAGVSAVEQALFAIFNPRTDAEIALGVTPADYEYPEGTPERYGESATNMAPHISTAIAVMEQKGGGIVKLRERTYATTAAIVGKANVTIQGCGYGTKIAVTSAHGITYDDYTGFGLTKLCDFYIYGAAGTTFTGIKVLGTEDIVDELYSFSIHNVMVTDFNTGINFRSARRISVFNVWVQNVNTGIQCTGRTLLAWFDHIMLVHGDGNGAGTVRGFYVLTDGYDTGGTQPPEGIECSHFQSYGFDYAIDIEFCNVIYFSDFDCDGRIMGIRFTTIQHGAQFGPGFINGVGTSFTDGIAGEGLASELNTEIAIHNVSVLGSSNTAGTSHGIRINGSGNTNQYNVHITGGNFDGLTLYDILLNNPGNSSVRNTKCTSTGVTKSIKIGTVQKGLVIVEGNHCAGNIETVSADAVAGKVRSMHNMVGGTNRHSTDAKDWYEEGSWTPVDGSGAGLVFTSNTGTYTRIGNMVYARFALTYPATADATANLVSGLPYTVANTQNARQGWLGYCTLSAVDRVLPTNNGTTFSFRTAAGVQSTNATMTGAVAYGTLVYPIS